MPRKMEPKRLCYLKSRVFDPSFLYEFLALGKPELSTVKFPPGSPYHYVTKNLRPYRTLVIFLGTPGFWKHHLAGHITIWWLRLKLLFRNQIYDTDLCFLLIIINKERWRILSKLYFGLQFPHFPTWLCKKKRAARPGDLSSSPSIDTLQALRLEMTEDYYYDLPDRRMCSERRGVLIWPWRMKTWATETKRGLLGVSTNIKDEAEIWWGKTNNKHSSIIKNGDIPSGRLSWLENLSIV